jgi:DNA repair protein RadC
MLLPKIKISINIEGKAERTKLTRPSEIFEAVTENWEPDTIDLYESFYVVCLSRNLYVNGMYKISEGGLHGTVVDISKIILGMVNSVSCSMILLHNHPSGNLQPSTQDLDITNKIVAASKILGYSVLDHLIITSDGFYSFADQGHL